MFAHHVDNTMEKKLFLKKHNFNIKAYTLCVGLFFYKNESFMEGGILRKRLFIMYKNNHC